MYTKTIILMQDKRYEKFIKLMLKKKNRAVETDLMLLSDMDSVKNDIYKNRNTINIRGEFGHFVKQYGLPYMMIIDYMIDFGFPGFAGTDDRKLAQTFILSYTILAQAKGYDNGSANIVFIVNKKHESAIKQFAKYPLFLLDQIRTKDERVNSIIDSFAIDKERVKGFFKIAYILRPDDGKYADELERLERIMVVYDKIISSKPQIEAEETVEMVSDDAEPADVICRATIEKIITNGELKPISVDQKNQYVEKNVHLRGAVTMKTIQVVQERILETFTSMAKVNPFKKDEKIFIHIPDSTLIDGSFASSMGTFFTTVLAEYTGIYINIGRSNLEKVKKSQGFIAIKDFILKNL